MGAWGRRAGLRHDTDTAGTRSAGPRRAAPERRPLRAPSLLLGVALVLVPAGVSAQGGAIDYQVGLANRAHHEAVITVTFPNVPGPVLEVRMSRSSPGRYALHEFAKNVYGVVATDGQGRSLTVTRADPHQWNVEVGEAGGTVVFGYTLFADRVDGTYSAVDRTHSHFNGPATWAWARGMEDRPVRLALDLPEGWRVATQLAPTEDDSRFTAPDLQYLMDSPVEASDHRLFSWPIGGPAAAPDRQQTVRVALHHLGSEEDAEIYAELTRAIVDEQIAIFGEPPAFDYGTYTFLADYLPWASGDGMEHRNSTVLSSSLSLEDALLRLLGTVSHEFFHAWNIERIRPRSLEPFDFERANMSDALWFGEGFTSYYDDLTLARAGILSLEQYVEGLGGGLAGFLAATGRRYHSPVEMSHQAPFVDAATWIDRGNRSNTFISYYTYGAMLGLGLDLELRTSFDVTLDDFMRAVWRQHGVTGRPYDLDDLERILGEVAAPDFAATWFADYVRGSELPDYAALLEAAGLVLEPRHPERGWVGRFGAVPDGNGFRIEGGTQVDGPLYRAGIDHGDVVRAVDGEAMDENAFRQKVENAAVGDQLTLAVEGRGAERMATVTVASDPGLALRTFESVGREVTPAIEAFRSSWLGRRGSGADVLRRCPDGGRTFPLEQGFCPWHGTALEPVLRAPDAP